MDNNTMFISNIEVNDDNIVLIPNREVKNLINATCYKLIICCNVNATSNLPLFIRTAIGDIPILCRFSNTLYANQLTKRTMYRIGYGNANDSYELGQFTIQCNVLPKSETTTVLSL